MRLQGGGTALDKNEAIFDDITSCGKLAERREHSCGTGTISASCTVTFDVHEDVASVVAQCRVAQVVVRPVANQRRHAAT